MKKTIITVIISVVVTLGLVFGVNLISKVSYNKKVEERGIKSIKEVEYSIPRIEISIKGIYNSYLSEENLKDVKVYEIEAVMDDTIENTLYTYKGVRITDILSKYNITDYTSITFKANDGLQVLFRKNEINENMFLVFNRDGKDYKVGEGAALLVPDLNARYSITNVSTLTFD